MIEIRLFKKYELDGYILIDAFPGVGLVGPMAGSYMIEKLKMEYIGYIESDQFPPIAAIHHGMPMFPARIYKDDKYKLVVVMSEFVIPAMAVFQLSRELIDFIRKNGLSKCISISGMPSPKPSDVAYITSPSPTLLKEATKAGLKTINEGVVAGIGAVIMVNSVQFKIESMNILVEVNPQVMDPKYAEVAIFGLNKLIGISIDLKDLEEEAKIVESKMRELLKKVKETPEHYNKAAEATGPSMYA